jgi:hypothetical protein
VLTFDGRLDRYDRVPDLSPPHLRYGLVGWWRGSSGQDYSGYGNHVIPGSSSTTRQAPFGIGSAYFLNATVATALIGATSRPSINTQALTYAAWINLGATGLFKVVYGGNTATRNPQMLTNNANPATIGFSVNGSGSTLNSPATLTTGKWYHVAASYIFAGDECCVYLNGVRVAHSKPFGNSSALVYTGGQMGIGGNSSFIFNGQIADMRVYNRVLADAEVYQIYALPFVTGFESIELSLMPPPPPATGRKTQAMIMA